MRTNEPTILAIDPGTRELGFALLRGPHLIDCGVLTLRHVPPQRRLTAVKQAFERWISAGRPDALVLEDIPSRPRLGGLGLPSLGRLLRRLSRHHGLALSSYSAKAVRRSLLNNGWAGKAEIVGPLVGRFPELRVYRGQNRKWKDHHWHNLFDAVALALHHQAIAQPPSRCR